MTPDALATLLPAIAERVRRYQEGSIDETISPHDNMFEPRRREHYFAVGRDAVTIVAQAMIKAHIDRFADILDLPCGSGRVLRHFARFFPDASLMAADIVSEHVEFCARQFGAEPLLSRHDLRQVNPGRSFDLVWCGSLLTHLPASRFTEALRHMVGWLAPGGVAVFTLHGRWSLWRQRETPYKYMDDAAFAPLAEAAMRNGFGYVDYPDSCDPLERENYGFSVSLPSWVTRIVETMADVRLLDYMERGWDNHQDVVMLRKIPIAGHPWLFEDRHGGHRPTG